MKTTVFFGGTFNPLHNGHYEMLAALERRPEVDEILIIPDRVPPHKKFERSVSDEDRIAMCRIAAADFPKAEVSLIEFEREGKSYTYDTVRLLRKREPETVFCMACGGDMIATLHQWYEAEKLLRLIGFYGFRREGLDGFDESVAALRKWGASVTVDSTVIPKVSSTEMRNRLAAGEKDLPIPTAVLDYILERNLYHGS